MNLQTVITRQCAVITGASLVGILSVLATAYAQPMIATDEPVQAMLIARTPTGENANMPLVSEELHVAIDAQYATTRLKQVYHNRSGATVEGQYRLQAGSGARVEGFAYWNGEQKIVGEVFEKQIARRIYNSVTSRRRDPGLLEEVADGVFAFKIFPIAPNENKRVQIDYTAWLERRGETVRYRAPIGHSGANISVTIANAGAIRDVRSPTHKIHVDKLRSGELRVQIAGTRRQAGEFVLTYKMTDSTLTARAYVHKDRGHDGYFALALAAPPMPESAVTPKDLTLVLDRSGSMAGQPLEQAKVAAMNVIRRLGKNDRVNVISFDDEVYPLFESPKPADKTIRERALAFISRMTDGGGTDLALALETAFKSQEQTNRPRVLLFLTDGQSDSRSTLQAAQADQNDVRVFTVGLGQGVNRPLLSRLSATKRGRFTYIAGSNTIERDVGILYRQISRPLMVDLSLNMTGVRGLRMYPRSLPDLFVEDEIVITGRLVGTGLTSFTLRGLIDGKRVSTTAKVQVAEQVNRPWVGKLWAKARVAHLLEEIALTGSNRELENEVIELALAYNFVTKYTSFLAIPESELTGEARNMMLSARERKRKIMAERADAAALKRGKKKGGHIRASGNTGQGRSSSAVDKVLAANPAAPAKPAAPPSTAPKPTTQSRTHDFEDEAVEGDLLKPDGEMVDVRSMNASPRRVQTGSSGDLADEEDSDRPYGRVAHKGSGCAGCRSTEPNGRSFLWLLVLVGLVMMRRRIHSGGIR